MLACGPVDACGGLGYAVLIPEPPYEKARGGLAVHDEERVGIDEEEQTSPILWLRRRR